MVPLEMEQINFIFIIIVKLKIAYYTSGLTGTGRIIPGISIGNAIIRKNLDAEIIIVSSSPFTDLIDRFNFNHLEVPPENENTVSEESYIDSEIYNTLLNIQPDILLVDLLWFPLNNFINKLRCKKIFLSRQVDNNFFSINLEDETISFRPDDYDLVLATEPFSSTIKMDSINPIIIRNKNEILSRDDAFTELNLNDNKKNCLLAYNGHPGDFERVKNDYSYLENEGFQIIYTTNYKGGIFPVVDYFNAFDLIISGAGYNQFWEARFFDKEAIFIPTEAFFVSGERRIKECHDFYFKENGADQLVDIINNMI